NKTIVNNTIYKETISDEYKINRKFYKKRANEYVVKNVLEQIRILPSNTSQFIKKRYIGIFITTLFNFKELTSIEQFNNLTYVYFPYNMWDCFYCTTYCNKNINQHVY